MKIIFVWLGLSAPLLVALIALDAPNLICVIAGAATMLLAKEIVR